jgi:hypothetical protein
MKITSFIRERPPSFCAENCKDVASHLQHRHFTWLSGGIDMPPSPRLRRNAVSQADLADVSKGIVNGHPQA